MSKKIIFAIFCLLLGMNLACQTDSTINTNKNVKTATDPKTLPSEFNTKPISPTSSNTPGIPNPKEVDVSKPEKGATPTPGIPDSKDIGKPAPKGATPTPGIPDPVTIKEQLKKQVNDPNVVNQPPTDSEKPGPLDRKRKVQRPVKP